MAGRRAELFYINIALNYKIRKLSLLQAERACQALARLSSW